MKLLNEASRLQARRRNTLSPPRSEMRWQITQTQNAQQNDESPRKGFTCDWALSLGLRAFSRLMLWRPLLRQDVAGLCPRGE